MHIRIRKRQTGKTMGIVEELKKDKHAIMIVCDEHTKRRVLQQETKRDQVVTMYEVMNRKLVGRRYSKVYIDEVGLCLDRIIGHIEYGTHTNE